MSCLKKLCLHITSTLTAATALITFLMSLWEEERSKNEIVNVSPMPKWNPASCSRKKRVENCQPWRRRNIWRKKERRKDIESEFCNEHYLESFWNDARRRDDWAVSQPSSLSPPVWWMRYVQPLSRVPLCSLIQECPPPLEQENVMVVLEKKNGSSERKLHLEPDNVWASPTS